MLLNVKFCEIFPERNECGLISESFILNWYIFVALTNKKLLFPLKCRLKKKSFWSCKINIIFSFYFIVVHVILVLDLHQKVDFFSSNIHWWTIVYFKNNDIFTSIKIWKWKKRTRIKFNTIFWIRIFLWIVICR